MGQPASERPLTVVWRPQPGPQVALLSCPCFEVFFGGARGGGKTDGMLGDWAQHAQAYAKDAIGTFFRRERVQLDEAIERAKELYMPLGSDWKEQKSQFIMPNGARLKFRHLERDADAEAYQGHSYTRIYIEELTNFPDPKPVMKLKATLRSGRGVPCRFRATGNPGGPGHQWVKARYIDPSPLGMVPIIERVKIGGREIQRSRVFIPSKLSQNKFLGDDYVANLATAGSEALVKAWLEGNWDVIDGAYFDCWQPDKHVIRPFAIPDHWYRYRSFDWGSARPFACYWIAVSDGVGPLPKGALVVYREWYGAASPNVGLKMRVEDVAVGIVKREASDPVRAPDGSPGKMSGVADPAIFSEDGGPSIAERMRQQGCHFLGADNKRVPGWDQLRARLIGEDEKPMLYFFSNCVNAIRTIPALQHDDNRLEDIDTDGEDHSADSIRYACMARPYTRVLTPKVPARGLLEMTMDELWAKTKTGSSKRI